MENEELTRFLNAARYRESLIKIQASVIASLSLLSGCKKVDQYWIDNAMDALKRIRDEVKLTLEPAPIPKSRRKPTPFGKRKE